MMRRFELDFCGDFLSLKHKILRTNICKLLLKLHFKSNTLHLLSSFWEVGARKRTVSRFTLIVSYER